MDYLLSRHPIYKSKIDVVGYEIRARLVNGRPAGWADAPAEEQGGHGLLTEAGLNQIAGTHSCYLTLTPEALMQGWWKQMPANKVVLGYFDTFAAGDDAALELLHIAEKGFRVALSGAIDGSILEKFGGKIHAVRLDVTAFSPDGMMKTCEDLKGRNIQILAGNVDTYDDLEYCQSLGFDLYQGRFISRMAAKEARDIPVNKLTMMRVLSKLQNPSISMPDLEKTVSHDAALSYKLLSYANSAAISLPTSVRSVGHACRMVGLNMLRTWASVLLLSSVDDKPRELLNIALTRARMCERLAESMKGAVKDSFFSAGLLSVIDALLDCPMEKALQQLPLIDEVKSALIHQQGPAGQALNCALAYEHADWDAVKFNGMELTAIQDTYLDAIAWSRQISGGLLN